jgi:chromosomal replication initiation ATPase DnaA
MSHHRGWDLVGRSELLDAQLTFENFEVSRSNRDAFDRMRSVAVLTSPSEWPFVIESEPGLGKTHLFHALAHTFREQGRHRHRIWDCSTWATAVDDFKKREGVETLLDLMARDDLLVLESIDHVDPGHQPLIFRLITERKAAALPTLVSMTTTLTSTDVQTLPDLKTLLMSSPRERIYRSDILLATRIARRWAAINKIVIGEPEILRAVQGLQRYFQTVLIGDSSGLNGREVLFMIYQLHSWSMLNGVSITTRTVDAFLRETLRTDGRSTPTRLPALTPSNPGPDR